MSHAFELADVAKYYHEVTALDGVTLSGREGEIYALLGPNGAGKSTIIKVLSTLVIPDRGVARVGGVDVMEHPDQVRRLIGMAGQYAAVDEFQTGAENIYMIGELYGLTRQEAHRRTGELLERLDLVAAGQRPVSTYSGGMRRRLDLGASLVGRPRILFLDEPTTGLDPKTRNDVWDIIDVPSSVKASVTSHAVTLTGEVRWQFQRAAAVRTVRARNRRRSNLLLDHRGHRPGNGPGPPGTPWPGWVLSRRTIPPSSLPTRGRSARTRD